MHRRDVAGLLIVTAVSAAVVFGCRSSTPSLTVAAAILPGELPAYRAVLADFERATGKSVIVVPQQYSDVRRAIAAERAAGSGTIDVAELDVHMLASARDDVRPLDRGALGDVVDVLDPETVRAG